MLAAGSSSRFGRDNKLLAPIDGKPMCAHALDSLLNSSIPNIIVVTGYQHEHIRASLLEHCSSSPQFEKVVFINNDQHDQGMGRSISTALPHIGDASAVLVCLADMPRVSTEIINTLHQAWLADNSHFAYIPVHKGSNGNPVLLNKPALAQLKQLKEDMGAKQLLKEHEQLLLKVPIASDAILNDIDTPADWQGL